METKFEFTKYAGDNGIAEIMQSLAIRMSFLSWNEDKKCYTNAHSMIICRDFFGDVLWAKKTGKAQGIYGFKFDPKKQSIIDDSSAFCLEFPSEGEKALFLMNLHYLHEWEDKAGVKRTEVMEVPDNKQVLLTFGDKVWKENITSISAYTFIFKCIGYDLDKYEGTFEDKVCQTEVTKTRWDGSEYEADTIESQYMSQTIDYFGKLITNVKRLIAESTSIYNRKVEEKNMSISTIHNQCGFVSAGSTSHEWRGILDGIK